MKLKTSQLKEFQKKASLVQSSSILPCLAYFSISIKDGLCRIVKTNLSSFCKYSFPTDSEECEMLIEEKVFFDFVNVAKSEEISIELSGTVVTLRENNRELSFGTISFSEYPNFPESEPIKNPVTFDSSVIQAISNANKVTDRMNAQMPYACYVYTNDNCVWASNGFLLYRMAFEGLPTIALNKEFCTILSQYSQLEYYTHGNYYFFDGGSTCHAFVIPEISAPNFEQLLHSLDNDRSKYMKIDKEQLEIFCACSVNLVVGYSHCSMSFIDSEKLMFLISDGNAAKSNKMEISAANSKEFETFNFDAKYMQQIIKVLPYDYLLFNIQNNKIIILHEDDKNFLGIIMGIQNLTKK